MFIYVIVRTEDEMHSPYMGIYSAYFVKEHAEQKLIELNQEDHTGYEYEIAECELFDKDYHA